MALFHTTVVDNQIKALDTIGSVSGAICTFETDKAERLVNLEVAITATGGGGTPVSPIAINGFSACDLVACGKNLANTDLFSNTSFFTINADGTVTQIANDNRSESTMQTIALKAGTYTISRGVTHNNMAVYYYDNGWVYLVPSTSAESATFTVPTDIDKIYIKWSYGGYTGYPRTLSPQIEVGSRKTEFEPYNGTTETIPFGQTVYGGRLNVGSGVLTVTNICYNLIWGDGTNSTDLGNYIRRRFTHTEPTVYPPTEENPQLCDKAPYLAAYSQDSLHFYINSTDTYLYLPEGTSDSEQIMVVAELQTPITIQLDSKQIQAIIGNNNIYADCGDIIDLKFVLSVGQAIS